MVQGVFFRVSLFFPLVARKCDGKVRIHLPQPNQGSEDIFTTTIFLTHTMLHPIMKSQLVSQINPHHVIVININHVYPQIIDFNKKFIVLCCIFLFCCPCDIIIDTAEQIYRIGIIYTVIQEAVGVIIIFNNIILDGATHVLLILFLGLYPYESLACVGLTFKLYRRIIFRTSVEALEASLPDIIKYALSRLQV